MTVTADTPVGTLATAYPATIKVFQQYGIDFCCGGAMAVREACGGHDAPLANVIADLNAALGDHEPDAGPDWRLAPMSDLIAHVIATYHVPQRQEFARLEDMLQTVLRVHGDHWPQMLGAVANTFRTLRAEAEVHTRDEEEHVFPAMAELDRQPHAGADALDPLLDDLEREHIVMGALLADLTWHTHGFEAPADACATFQGLFHGLHALADDLKQHVALENHVLFPRAAALARTARR
ncbi:MAG TPA: DUF542 domain-containing protein [Vicinamibacterales bacterium]|nr:DUF542 domain-containing protein [Vicinamibacterales bacterium]